MSPANKVVSCLNAFGQSPAAQTLWDALTALERADEAATAPPAREATTHAWLAVLSAVDRSINPAFDPADMPALSVIPPKVNGKTFFAGVNPDQIGDPDAKAKYEADIQAQRQKAYRYAFQNDLRALQRRAGETFELYLRQYYSSLQADRKELKRILASAPLSPNRSQSLQTLAESL